MQRRSFLTLVVVVIALNVGPVGFAQMIDFESLPGGASTTDGLSISNQYAGVFGVTFSLLDHNTGQPAGFPVIAKVGPPRTAFQGCPGDDEPLAGQGVGQSFLTDDGVVGTATLDLLITYQTPVAQASGVLLDVDLGPAEYEEWTITGRDAANAMVAQTVITAPIGPNNPECAAYEGGPGDGRAFTWSLSTETRRISSILIRFTGTVVNGVGVAFDNFSPAGPPQCETRRPGDVSGDGVSNVSDVGPFVRVILNPSAATPDEFCAADVNVSGTVDGVDIQGFVNLIVGP